MADNEKEPSLAQQNKVPLKRRRRRKKKKRGKKRAKVYDNSPLGELRRIFVGCARCSQFLAAYQADHGVDEVREEAEGEKDWIFLSWNQTVRRRLLEGFGGSIDQGSSFYSIICPQCRRLYEVEMQEGEDEMLRVQVNPKTRR